MRDPTEVVEKANIYNLQINTLYLFPKVTNNAITLIK